ncbi:L-2-hydroxyglutarate oxidase [Amaricoccus sp.]|uniref:L-2-hydroxyglutarate oxidase n=1 Tax=Amaricoccus sp. TaxID=1872485 RepID=UPI001B661453|nr:L-2-hydroxyglutarate oxidase [Amaricoccus sp.]MBP7243451.1 L-2-hydroxyglutarate oxidase [Amaricoccus sp.]
MIHDFCIVGAGIVGLATARALLERRPGASLVILEKEEATGRHQTGRNSGVIHSGVYYAPGSLKARLCRDGSERTMDFCEAHGVPFERRGKLIVATRPEELPRLDELERRAAENGVETERLDAAAIRAREPAITGLAALSIPAASIVSYRRVLDALAAELRAGGAELRLSTAPEAIREGGDAVEIATPGGTVRARRLVACAGLQSDRVARMAGLRVGHRIVPFRGEYFRLAPRLSGVVRAMIYPVPDPALPFLGIHLTPMIDGSVTVGPNAALGFAREGYRKGSVSARDVADMATFAGFWRCMAQNLRPGLAELGDSLFRRRYLAACRRYCPELTLEDLAPMEPGIRAQAVLADGTLEHDFLFLDTPRSVHVCNAPSPAATSALPIGDMIADRVLAGTA